MASTLTVTVAQPLIVADDLVGNVERHAAVVRRASAAVVVFPELSLVGYRLDAATVDPADGRLEPLVDACGAGGTIALVGAPTIGLTGDHLSVLAIDGSGVRIVYHKLYLGGDELKRFVAGSDPSVLEIDGWRLGLAVCRDTGVPEHAERTAALGVDGFLASVCEHAADHEVIAQRANRIADDHGVWVAVASFAGSTGHGFDPAAGRSGIWANDGGCIEQTDAKVGRIVTAVRTR